MIECGREGSNTTATQSSKKDHAMLRCSTPVATSGCWVKNDSYVSRICFLSYTYLNLGFYHYSYQPLSFYSKYFSDML